MISPSFEVNTDIALIDPDWEAFATEHERRYGLAIAYLKSVIQGTSYSNNVMDLVVGDAGFYAQSKRFPAAFYGETGRVTFQLVSEAEAQAAAWEAVALYRAGEAQSLTAVWSDAAPTDVFFGYRFGEGERYEMGGLKTSLPLHFRAMVSAPEAVPLLGNTEGVLLYQRTALGQHLLIRAPGARQPFALLDGFDV